MFKLYPNGHSNVIAPYFYPISLRVKRYFLRTQHLTSFPFPLVAGSMFIQYVIWRIFEPKVFNVFYSWKCHISIHNARFFLILALHKHNVCFKSFLNLHKQWYLLYWQRVVLYPKQVQKLESWWGLKQLTMKGGICFGASLMGFAVLWELKICTMIWPSITIRGWYLNFHLPYLLKFILFLIFIRYGRNCTQSLNDTQNQGTISHWHVFTIVQSNDGEQNGQTTYT